MVVSQIDLGVVVVVVDDAMKVAFQISLGLDRKGAYPFDDWVAVVDRR